MLARASSDAGTRLRRSKSSSTVHRYPPPLSEPLDPDTARQYAVKAATVAFARSQTSDIADRKTKRSSEISRCKSNASRKSLTSQGSHFPPRMPSSRSLQPQKARESVNSHYTPCTTSMDTEQFPPFHPVTSSEKPWSMPRPLSAQPSITFNEEVRPRSQPKANRQSASSSVTSQRLRKARSMYYASSIQTGSPIARPPAKYLTTPPSTSQTSAPTLESTPALLPARTLEPSPLASARMPVTLAVDETLDAARDKYLQSFQQKSVKHKPSIFLAPFKKRQEKAKENSHSMISNVGTSSATSRRTPDDSMADNSLQDFLSQPKTKEKRSLSGSLRNKLRRVFRRASDKTPNLPVQQIEASREYFMTQPGASLERDDAYTIPSPDEETLQRTRSRNPSDALHSPPPRCKSRNSSNGSARSNRSNRSLHSEINATHVSTSRMTSWATSSTGDALPQGAIKRLTVIHESKDSTGSEVERLASVMPRRKSLPHNVLSAFRDPMPMQGVTEDSLAFVDPKRVFSALLREMETTKSAPEPSNLVDGTPFTLSDVESSETKGQRIQNDHPHSMSEQKYRSHVNGNHLKPSRKHASITAQNMHGKTSTIRSLGKAIKSTIRAVTPVERQPSNPTESEYSVHGTICATNADLPTLSAAHDSELTQSDCQKAASSAISPAQAELPSLNQDRSTEFFTPSFSQIEKRVERANDRWKTPLEEAESPQFPRETARKYNVTNIFKHTMPYETPGRGVVGHAESLRTNGYENEARDIGGPAKSTAFLVSPMSYHLKSPLSPSIYSRNTDGISILPNDSVTSLRIPERHAQRHDEGSAIILTSQSVRSYVIGTPSPHRPDSTRMSRDWKDWLSHEISGIDVASQEDLRIHENLTSLAKEPRRNALRSSHTEHSEATVILHEACDASPPIPELVIPTSVERPKSDEKHSIRVRSQQQDRIEQVMTSVVREKHGSAPESFEASARHHNLNMIDGRDLYLHSNASLPSRSPLPNDQRAPVPVASYTSLSQPVLETPKSSRMNDRFPFIETGASISSKSASSSGKSKSPTGSVLSLNSPKLSKLNTSSENYSNLSAPSTAQTCRRMYNRGTNEQGAQHEKRKENLLPTALCENSRPSTSISLVPSRPTTSQSISSAPTDYKRSTVGQSLANAPFFSHFKRNSSPTAAPPRPHVRVTLHPVSPEKLSRRPKSVYSLRKANQQDMKLASKRLIIDDLATPSPGLPSERRRTALHLKTSSSSLALNKEPSPGTEQRNIDNVLEDERSGSVTPGQRMVDRFLRERKSASMIEGVKWRGGLRLAREDTPAFL